MGFVIETVRNLFLAPTETRPLIGCSLAEWRHICAVRRIATHFFGLLCRTFTFASAPSTTFRACGSSRPTGGILIIQRLWNESSSSLFIGRFFESDAIGCCCLFVLFCSWPTLRFFSLKAANYERVVEAGIRSATPLDHTGTPCHDSFIPDVRVSPQAPFSFVSFSVNGQLSSESCYRVLLGFSGLVEGSSVPDSLLPTTSSSFYVMEWDFTEFYWVLLGFPGLYWVLLGCTGFWGKIVKWNAKMGPILYCRPIELFLWVRMGFY